MGNNFSNEPRGLRGAFVEFSYGPPTLIVPFQFNPVQLTRSRSLSFSIPGEAEPASLTDQGEASKKRLTSIGQNAMRKEHQKQPDLMKLAAAQQVDVQEESINLEIRLDATDKLEEGDEIAVEFGIAPQLAVLEQMVYPRSETILGTITGKLASKGFSYSQGPNPPLVLFIWGRRWVLPVNINSVNITESEFNTSLYPLRATVSVALTVIEGPNPPYKLSLTAREALAVMGMKTVVDVVIPS